MNRTLLVVAACLVGLVSGCKPKAQGSCKIETKEVCIDDKQALACHGGKWEEMPCRGPAGCAKTGAENVCDQSVAADKDVCNLNKDYVCTSDKKGMLECQNHRWTLVESCLGERGCVIEQKKVTCDNSIASVGDGCKEEGDYGCSPDGKSVVVCRAGKFVGATSCKGKNGCRVSGDKAGGFKVDCDDSIASVGDPCEHDGHYACTPDERSMVKCVNKKFVQDDKCRAKDKCSVRGELVGCY